MRRLHRAMRVALAALALAGSTCPLVAQTPQQIEQATDEAIRRLDLQTQLPVDAADSPSGFAINLPPEVYWIVIALGVALVLYSFRDMLPVWRLVGRAEWDDAGLDAGSGGAQAPSMTMVAADELARQGRFVEAMHVLLLQSLAEIRRCLDQHFADSLTSREILRSTALSEAGHAALREIIARVEWSYFGEHPAALADYTATRESFDRLTRSLQGGAGA